MALGFGTLIFIAVAGAYAMKERSKKKSSAKTYDFPAAFPEEWDGRTVALVPNRKYRLPAAAAAAAGMTSLVIREFEYQEGGGYVEGEAPTELAVEALSILNVADTDDRAILCYAGAGGIACVEIEAESKKTKDEKAMIALAQDCSEWEMPEEWIIQVGRPLFDQAVDESFDAAPEGEPVLIDPIAVTHFILDDELGGCPVPQTRFTDVSSQLPSDDPNYYPYDAVLGLYGHVYEAVDYALARIVEAGDPNAATIFEIEEE